jgi:nucleotide-binding universal stress UspA family protein
MDAVALAEKARAEGENYLSHVTARARAAGVETAHEVLAGDPKDLIVQTAAAEAADIIAMTTQGRTGLARVSSAAQLRRSFGALPVRCFSYGCTAIKGN